MNIHPELAVVTQWGADHVVVRSFVSQLLEYGIHFEHGKNQGLLDRAPDDLDQYKAIVFDHDAYVAAVSDDATRQRLETYARDVGFVIKISDPSEGVDNVPLHASFLIDLLNHGVVANDILMHGRLTRDHPEAIRRQLQRDDAEIIASLEQRTLDVVKRMRGWHEGTLHTWKAARSLLRLAGRDELRDALITAVREAAQDVPLPLNHDFTGGYFNTVWYRDETGDAEPMNLIRQRTDMMLERRPRHMGVLTGTGFLDDPFALVDQGEGIWSYYLSNTIMRRETLWNEGLHMYGPGLAALTRGTGDPKYLDEALRYVDHIRQYHLRDDGLLAHSSSHGKPLGLTWARGTLHALIGMLYMLEEMPREHPRFDDMLNLLDTVGRTLIKHQDAESGLWRNLIDHPDARRECSGTAGFGYIYARCINEGWLDRDTYEPMVRAAWQGLKRLAWRDGFAANCRGSGPAPLPEYYLARPQGFSKGPPQCWATMLMVELQMMN